MGGEDTPQSDQERVKIDLNHTATLQEALRAGEWKGSIHLRVTPNKPSRTPTNTPKVQEKGRLLRVDDSQVSIVEYMDGGASAVLSVMASPEVLTDILYMRYDAVTAVLGGLARTNDIMGLMSFVAGFHPKSKPFVPAFWGNPSDVDSTDETVVQLVKQSARFDFPFTTFHGMGWDEISLIDQDSNESQQSTLSPLHLALQHLEEAFEEASWEGIASITITKLQLGPHPDAVGDKLELQAVVVRNEMFVYTNKQSCPSLPSLEHICSISMDCDTFVSLIGGSITHQQAIDSNKITSTNTSKAQQFFSALRLSKVKYESWRVQNILTAPNRHSLHPGSLQLDDNTVVRCVQILGRTFSGSETRMLAVFNLTDAPSTPVLYIGVTPKILTVASAPPADRFAWAVSIEVTCSRFYLEALVCDEIDGYQLANQGCIAYDQVDALAEFFEAFGARATLTSQWLKYDIGAHTDPQHPAHHPHHHHHPQHHPQITPSTTPHQPHRFSNLSPTLDKRVRSALDVLTENPALKSGVAAQTLEGAVGVLRITVVMEARQLEPPPGASVEMGTLSSDNIVYTFVVAHDGDEAKLVVTRSEDDSIDADYNVKTDKTTFLKIMTGETLPGVAHKDGLLIVDNRDKFVCFCQSVDFDYTKQTLLSQNQQQPVPFSTSPRAAKKALPTTSPIPSPHPPPHQQHHHKTLNDIPMLSPQNLPMHLETTFTVDLTPPPPPSPPRLVPVPERQFSSIPNNDADDANDLQTPHHPDRGDLLGGPSVVSEIPPDIEVVAPLTDSERVMAEERRLLIEAAIQERAGSRAQSLTDWREEAKNKLRFLNDPDMFAEREGLLTMKKGDAWKVRYFILKGRQLVCYGRGFLEGKIEFHWKTTLGPECVVSNPSVLTDSEKFELPPPLQRFTHTFQLVDPKSKTREFAAMSKEDAQQWIEVFRKSIMQRNATSVRGIPLMVNTFSGLIKELTSFAQPMPDSHLMFVKAFLATHRAFSNPLSVFHALKTRFEQNNENQVRDAVVNVVEIWLLDQFYDFQYKGDGEFAPLERRVSDWGQDLIGSGDAGRGELLHAAIKLARMRPANSAAGKRSSLSMGRRASQGAAYLDWSRPQGLMHIDPEEVAEQITLMEQGLVQRIRPHELLSQGWTKDTRYDASPNVMACIDFFNTLTAKMTMFIVAPTTVKARARALQRVVEICQHLRLIGNFNSLKAILAAINSAAVSRLRHTRDEAGASVMDMLESLEYDLSGEQGHSRYRKILYASMPPAIPFMGVLLTDLSFVEDGNPDVVGTSTPTDASEPADIINFTKHQFLFTIIEDFRHYIDTPFSFGIVPALQTLIEDMPVEHESAMLSMAKTREPKGATRAQVDDMDVIHTIGEDEKQILRVLFPTGNPGAGFAFPSTANTSMSTLFAPTR